jgi:DNA-binding winged helix-turn-helix (wHTH) protein/Tfp pilus assembly protein PilF
VSHVRSAECFTFGPYELDARHRRLTRAGEAIAVSDRHIDLLLLFVSHAGQVLSKDALIEVAWPGLAVTDNSLEQAISSLRRTLGSGPGGAAYIETLARRGYRFAADVARTAARETDAALEALLAPHRAWVDGRAALETLERHRVVQAREAFQGVVDVSPGYAAAHVGLASACVMQFEATRADESPDAQALAKAAEHAREACRLESESGEAWATLGFVLSRTGQSTDAVAALRRAVTLEPDNWRHHFRLSYVSWGEARLRAAHRTLALLPGHPLAHWLAATVHVARQVFTEAERELAAGITSIDNQSAEHAQFGGVALHWLRGLIALARDEDRGALEAFERELSFEHAGHLYARECCSNTWYAIGALRLRRGQTAEARVAFEHALQRVSTHPLARVGLHATAAESQGRVASPETGVASAGHESDVVPSAEAALVRAAQLATAGRVPDAARLMDRALAAAGPGDSAWVLPVEPLLNVHAAPDLWAGALARLRTRAS